MSKKFDKKNSQKYAVVHRPHDDPRFYDAEASDHILVPINNPNERSKKAPTPRFEKPKSSANRDAANAHAGESALYGITFDDSKYDYTQHLKPIGLDPENSVFIPVKSNAVDDENEKLQKKKNIEDLFVEPSYRDEAKPQASAPLFQRGMATAEYLKHQEEISNDISGFRPDLNPALREVLEALEDEAYVINEDIEVVVDDKSKVKKSKEAKVENTEELEGDDDFFAELLGGGEAADEDEFEDEFDEWDVDNLQDYEDEHYRDEIEKLDNIENLEDLQGIDYQADVRRFQREKARARKEYDTDDDFSQDDLESIEPLEDDLAGELENEDEEEEDVLGDLPTIKTQTKGNKKRKERRKKGAMSDISGFSMSSSAIARTEVMTVLDDKYDTIINSYDNYEEEQEIDEEENYTPFDMKEERADFESLLDDFLDNYELESGGRKLAKKDSERDRLKAAADEASKGKLSMRRKRENMVNAAANSLQSLHL
ncbi:hypothetical protein Kpol_1032p85 [Vanderwaltozyma polyspora DSM 70294]|uniref:Protein LTV1 n=1 Tax=Vanderwaltozyma polyspora (strain ATCC 22028 / DSM 70294 / BCRC 21397 / CBS 2163 / NBRC 10782 / NRRL Y-8283 / UCD 57-17) TaxID=436907 RepID=A7TH36_VANPO|nr:uncharacterized protein Kpol_1032p85 [Vanderwaltozyma polyspora DSM 70294]EDO18488.1 hypothetical protein Kpol_1032p85 [Vanderwaltozyma polyspora DSM 70294]